MLNIHDPVVVLPFLFIFMLGIDLLSCKMSLTAGVGVCDSDVKIAILTDSPNSSGPDVGMSIITCETLGYLTIKWLEFGFSFNIFTYCL